MLKVGQDNCCLGFVSYVPVITGDELKTKPTQHGVRDLRMVGLSPDFIICRCEKEVPAEVRKKIAMFTNVAEHCVISAHNVPDINYVPGVLKDQNLGQIILEKLDLEVVDPALTKWTHLTTVLDSIRSTDDNEVKIAVVGKYTGL